MKIFFLDGKKAGEAFLLVPPGISLGRELDNDVVLESESASRYHAKIEWTEEGWRIRDLGSTNGTKVNGIKITEPCILKEGDKIKLGSNNFLFAEKLTSESAEKPLPATHPSPPAEEKPEQHSQPTLVEIKPETSAHKKPFLDFFNEKKAEQKEDSYSADSWTSTKGWDFFAKKKETKTDSESENPKKKSQIFFYIILALSAFILIALFILLEKVMAERRKPVVREEIVRRGVPLTVSYVKQISSPDNIFRYEMEISGDKIRVTRDDLKCHIRFTKSKQITKEQLNDLEDGIKQSDFMNMQPVQSGVSEDGIDEEKKLTVAFGKNLNVIRIKNTLEPQPFRDVVRLLEDFSETVLNIPAISLTADEMMNEAQIAFDKAEQLFNNYQAQDENLSEAIKRYQLTVEYLEYFEPKPAMFDKAFSKLQEAKRILLEEIKAHNANAITYQKRNDWLKAKEEYKKIMAKLEPDDKRYQQAREKVLMIEKHYKMDKKK